MDVILSGMRRSGTHVIASEIIKALPGTTWFFNDINVVIKPPEVHPPLSKQSPDNNVCLFEDKYPVGIVILRDIYNVTASRLKLLANRPSLKDTIVVHEKFVSKWITQARYCLEHPSNALIYNDWVVDPTVLQTLVKEKLGIDFNFSKPDRIISYGTLGSSFQTNTTPPEDKEVFLKRTNQVKIPAIVTRNKEVKELCKEIFGWSL